MMRLISAVAVLGLCLALPAQRMGSTNSNAPTVSSSIAFKGGAELSVKHVSTTWAEGRTMSTLMDKEGGARFRNMVNQRAASSPLGTLTVSSAFMLGGNKVEAGEHDLYFTIDEDLHWHMMLAHKGKDDVRVDVKLELQDADESSRLTVAVMAAKSDKEGTMKISFGKKACSMTFMAAASDK